MPTQKYNNEGKPLADVGLKWGRTPKTTTSTSMSPDNDSTSDIQNQKTNWEDIYTEEEKQKMRAKGINPALKAEIDAKRNQDGKGRERGFWGKVGQTAMGGGWIK